MKKRMTIEKVTKKPNFLYLLFGSNENKKILNYSTINSQATPSESRPTTLKWSSVQDAVILLPQRFALEKLISIHLSRAHLHGV